MNARDIAIRTILGEAAGEGPKGWAAVAHVLRNRAVDPRWPGSVSDVALQPKQFSAWNSGAGGNDLVNKYGPDSDPYRKVGSVYDAVMRGDIPDPTGGATHYYSPAGMQSLVNSGSQSSVLPRWLQAENARRGGNTVTIGGHVFTGRRNDLSFSDYDAPAYQTQADLSYDQYSTSPNPWDMSAGWQTGTPAGTPEDGILSRIESLSGIVENMQETQQQTQQKAPAIAPRQPPPPLPPPRDTITPYLNFFGGL